MALEILIPLFAIGLVVYGWLVGRYDGGVTSTAAQKRATSLGRRQQRRMAIARRA